MIVLDASALIAHFSAADPHHATATEILRGGGGDGLLVHPLTLAEVLVGAVRSGRGGQLRDDVRAVGVRLAARDDGEPLRLARLRVETRLELPDCCVLDAAENAGATLATFDDALAAAAHRRGTAVVPE